MEGKVRGATLVESATQWKAFSVNEQDPTPMINSMSHKKEREKKNTFNKLCSHQLIRVVDVNTVLDIARLNSYWKMNGGIFFIYIFFFNGTYCT